MKEIRGIFPFVLSEILLAFDVDKTKFEDKVFSWGKSNAIKRKICKFSYYDMVVILSSSIT